MKISDYIVTSPAQKNSQVSKIEHAIITELLESFEDRLKSATLNDDNAYVLTYYKEVDRNICSTIEEIYQNAGWTNVSCICTRYHRYESAETKFIVTLTLKS
jgi:hypothetical protein